MGKLNKSEIRAIAEDIVEKIKAKSPTIDDVYKEWETVFKTTPEYDFILSCKKQLDTLEDLLKNYKKVYDLNKSSYFYNLGINSFDVEDVIRWKFLEGYLKYGKKEENPPSIGLIEREIIIAQAKNESVDAIIETIINKYKK